MNYNAAARQVLPQKVIMRQGARIYVSITGYMCTATLWSLNSWVGSSPNTHAEKRQEYIQALILHSLEVQSYYLEGAQVNTLPSANLKLSFKFLTHDPHTEGT